MALGGALANSLWSRPRSSFIFSRPPRATPSAPSDLHTSTGPVMSRLRIAPSAPRRTAAWQLTGHSLTQSRHQRLHRRPVSGPQSGLCGPCRSVKAIERQRVTARGSSPNTAGVCAAQTYLAEEQDISPGFKRLQNDLHDKQDLLCRCLEEYLIQLGKTSSVDLSANRNQGLTSDWSSLYLLKMAGIRNRG